MTNKANEDKASTDVAGQVDPLVITLPRHPTADQIEAIFDLLRIRHSDSQRGIELQDKHKRFDTVFGFKTVAYERLVDYADKL